MTLRGYVSKASLRKQVNIRCVDQLRLLNTQPCHEAVSLANTRLHGFALLQHHLELEKMSQVSNVVQVNPCSANNKQRALLEDPPHFHIGECQCFTQRIGRGGG